MGQPTLTPYEDSLITQSVEGPSFAPRLNSNAFEEKCLRAQERILLSNPQVDELLGESFDRNVDQCIEERVARVGVISQERFEKKLAQRTRVTEEYLEELRDMHNRLLPRPGWPVGVFAAEHEDYIELLDKFIYLRERLELERQSGAELAAALAKVTDRDMYEQLRLKIRYSLEGNCKSNQEQTCKLFSRERKEFDKLCNLWQRMIIWTTSHQLRDQVAEKIEAYVEDVDHKASGLFQKKTDNDRAILARVSPERLQRLGLRKTSLENFAFQQA
jgi:hypothetical protein